MLTGVAWKMYIDIMKVSEYNIFSLSKTVLHKLYQAVLQGVASPHAILFKAQRSSLISILLTIAI